MIIYIYYVINYPPLHEIKGIQNFEKAMVLM